MAKLGIVTTPPIGTPLPDGGGNINSNFDELYSLLGDGSNLYPGIVTSITAGDNISISTSFGNVSISVTSTAFTETLDSVTNRGNLTTNGIRVGVLTANAFIKTGGTSSQFLKADGTVDNNTYLTSGSPTSGNLDDVTNNGNTTSNNINVGAVSALGNLSADVNVIAASNVSAGGSITAGGVSVASSFIRPGGSSSEFLKADGSIDSNQYATITFVNDNSGYWVTDSTGINTISNVGIGTDSDSNYTLKVAGIVSAAAFSGDGSALTNITGLGDTTGLASIEYVGLVTAGLASIDYVDTLVGVSTEGLLSETGDGSQLTGINTITIDNDSVVKSYPVFVEGTAGRQVLKVCSDYRFTPSTDTLEINNLTATGIVTASTLHGDGSNLTGLPSLVSVGLATAGLASIDYVDSAVASVGTVYWVKNNEVLTPSTNTDSILTLGNITAKDAQFSGNLDVGKYLNSSTGATFVGVVTASSFTGIGSQLTDLVRARWALGSIGTDDYTFTGVGFTQTTSDPDLYLERGSVYKFINNMNAHGFQIQDTPNGTIGNPYNNGVTNNGTTFGIITFEVPFNAPDTLYYQCTAHAGMGGTIFIYPALR